MANELVNKIIYDGKVLIDLTADTITPDKLLSGITAHDKSGATIEGACTFDSDTQDATVAVAEILNGKTAYARGVKLTGTMPNNGAVTGNISTKAGEYTIPQGYHDGSGKVSISASEQQKLVASNIRQGVTILGVAGSMSTTQGVTAQSLTVTPSSSEQTVTPQSGYNYLTSVTVNPIPYATSPNAAGGLTATIG